MKLPFVLLPVLALGLVSVSSATTIIDESFDTLPSSLEWKLQGTKVETGKLVLNAEGPEANFVGTSISTSVPNAGLNFAQKAVKITLTDIDLSGTAAGDRQAFVVLLGSDKANEADSTSYVRLIFNGNGTLTLGIPTTNAEGRRVEQTVLRRSFNLPLAKLTLTLDRTGHSIELIGGTKAETLSGKWDAGFNLAAWEKAVPTLLIKCVRRPASGDCVATLGAFTIDSK